MLVRALLAAVVAVVFLVAGCASPAPVTTDTASPVPSSTPMAEAPPERVLPAPVVPPPPFQRAQLASTRTATGAPGDAYWQQDARYVLTASLHPEERRLDGTARITYRNNAPTALNQLRIELAQNLHAAGVPRGEPVEITGGYALEHVVLDGDTLRAGTGYAVEGTQLALRTATPLLSGDATEIEMAWSYRIPQAGAGNRMGYSEDNLFFLAYWYPQMSVYDDVYGWLTDPFTGNAEFYANFADYDVTVDAPEGWLVLSTGALQNPDDVLAPEVAARMRAAYASDTPMTVVGPDDWDAATQTNPDGRLRWRFTAEQVRDIAFSATRASIWDAARTAVGDVDGDGQTDYAAINTLYRETAPFWSEVTRYQQHALTHQSEYTGTPYPWPHMTAVEGGGIIGGGMEFPMMTIMGDYNTRGDSALYAVTAHELAHMWVPMIVGQNERRYSWMDEGMTSFLENQSRQDFYPDAFNPEISDQRTYLFAARAGLEGEMMRWSDFHYPGPAFGVASYSKPATVLVALRAVLGDDVFLDAYRTFLDEWAYKHPYPWDFFNTMERVSGRELDWFWHSWYYTTWTLDHAVTDVQTGPDGTQIVVEDLGQVPMPVDLRVTLANGETLLITIPVETWLEGATRATVEVDAEVPVTRVAIDPEQRFPDVDRSNNTWQRSS